MDELTELQHDSSTAEATAPPDFRAIIQSAIGDMGLATSADVNQLSQRLAAVEATVADLPKVYASTDSVSKVKASQASYQSSQHKLTKQVAELANVVADSGRKYANIETRLNELSTLKTKFETLASVLETFTDNMTLFTSNQRERVEHHDARISNIERRNNELGEKVAFVEDVQEESDRRYITSFTPMHDFINGSPTQKPLKETLSHFETTMNTLNAGQVHQSTVLKSLEDYWKAQQAKEEARRNFYQRARIQLATPRGLIAILIVVIGVIMLMNAFSFDQLIARIQQLAVVVQLFRSK